MVEIQASKPIVPFRETAAKAQGETDRLPYYDASLNNTLDMAPPKIANAPRGTVQGSSVHNLVNFTIRAVPLPEDILGFVMDNLSVLRRLQRERSTRDEQTKASLMTENNHALSSSTEEDAKQMPRGEETTLTNVDEGAVEDAEDELGEDVQADVVRVPTVKPETFWAGLEEKCLAAGGEWANVADKVWAFGPQGAGGCLLIDARKGGVRNS
jgi:ribosome assembly protein 1